MYATGASTAVSAAISAMSWYAGNGAAAPSGIYSGEEVANLEAWSEAFPPQAEYLVQPVTELSAGFSQERGREAWAALESEVAALRRASCGMGSPAGSEAAGNFGLLAEVLEQRSLLIRGWGSALLAW